MAPSRCGMNSRPTAKASILLRRAVLALLYAGDDDRGAARGGPYTTEGPVWPNKTTTFNSFLSNGDLIFSTDISLDILAWNAVSAFKFVDTGNSSDPCNLNAPNGAAFGANDCGDAFGSGTLGRDDLIRQRWAIFSPMPVSSSNSKSRLPQL